ncbi:hypothetical protein SAMN02745216_01043 [Desulfatibacillum alkenivorans DSM 16219]|jgi:hypothetical protein|uniref:Peptidase C39-like domain-containing protein n=1 Tax=Desulfatibacillum alkenivorans DSM 16219 TaxID=1121393 RepID=A0A1M6GLH0_9BACT|nr:hypothetical protein [Desulfatibacillum alkenivorans]SHJ10781.1 hypothetical protein SAMN02745216_01043 [Desulfatibacillum alkenivorans DSM 16219]
MSRDVTGPPGLVAQETGAWCFAAAEQMVRAYLNMEVPSQYGIAYASLMLLISQGDPDLLLAWSTAAETDLLLEVDDDITPEQLEVSGNPPNPDSERVAMVKRTYGIFNHWDLGGAISSSCLPRDFREDIGSDKLVVIGNRNHYYVVYGYTDAGPFILRARDPFPPGLGAGTRLIPWGDFNVWEYKVVIRF